jgi:polysaccharide export outer membrane protein
MKISALTSISFLFLLSTVAAAQGTRPTGTAGSTGTPPATAGTSGVTTPKPPLVHSSPTVPAGGTDYRLVTGDQLRIEVYKDQQLSQSLQIRPDGKITLPLVGDIPAAGKTPTELRDAIAGSLKEYMTNPVVTVIVVETMPQLVYVMGEVYAPGPQAVKGEISILQALASAGGFKDFAKTGSIKVLRPGPTGTTELKFNYKDAIKGEAKMLMLRPGDTVIVP